ncbi:hypothetical protein BJX62DRAFT_213729 [Aspergillus germanicus]
MTPRVFAAAEDTNELAAWTTDIDSVWYREGDGDSNSATPSAAPHILALLMHHRPPPADLVRTELLVIMGIMRTRLEVYKEHEIAPVMLVTTFNETKARIIQGHYCDGQMVICKSDIYDFNTLESRQDNVSLFLAYMASEPVWDTMHMQAVEQKRGEQGDGSKIEVHGRNSECVERLCGRVSVTLTTAIRKSREVKRTSGLVLLTARVLLWACLSGASHPDIA